MDEPAPLKLALADFRAEDAAVILGWAETVEEAANWASVPLLTLRSGIFADWHAEEGVEPFVGLLEGGETCCYGEIWKDPQGQEAELARIIVAPSRRGLGIGRTFVSLLAAEVRRCGFQEVWLRVVPENRAAIASYRAAGFVRASKEEERQFNLEQPRDYVWLSLPRS
jgi:ribosomal protein S18 acetylase RimI-like enzyme